MYILNYKNCLNGIVFLLLSFTSIASQVDNEILMMSNEAKHLKEGKKLYRTVCATCHGKNLGGAMGFNLKDGEWIHGNKPSDILTNVNNGFSFAGMPAFASLYSKKQLKQVVAYVLSERQGFQGLSYKIYPLKDEYDLSIEGKTPIKTGKFAKGYIDFMMPEISHFAMEVEGDFYTRKDQPTQLYIAGKRPDKLDVEIDGKLLPFPELTWFPTWPLKLGKQHIKMTYYTGTSKGNYFRDLNVVVTDLKASIRFFPVSSAAHRALSKATVDLKSESDIVVHRKKVYQLPTYSISVGYPQKINYAFNTQTCSIVGLWNEDLLNIGPNVIDRGLDGSVALGDFLFKYPEQIGLDLSGDDICKFNKYSMNGDPTFYFSMNGYEMSLQSKVSSPNQITFIYQILNGKNVNQPLKLSLPTTKNLVIASSAGKIDGNILTVYVNKDAQFTVELSILEQK